MEAQHLIPLTTILLLGAFHGINPGMGWLFAVALGMQERRPGAVWQALMPLTLGHGLAIGAVVLVAVVAGVAVPAASLKLPVAVTLGAMGAYRLVRHSHFTGVGMRVGLGEGIVGWVTAQKQPLIVNDPQRDPRHHSGIAASIGIQPRNILCVPLVAAEGEVLGAIELLDKGDARRGFDETDLKLLVLIAGQASKAIQLARAKEERVNQGRLAAIGQMLSGVLHDLKTPMTIVSGWKLSAMMPASKPLWATSYLKSSDSGRASLTRSMNSFSAPMTRILCHSSSSSSPNGMPYSLRKRMRDSRGMRRSWLPGMR